MIIDAKSIVLTLVVVLLGCYGGLQLVRQFALQIAQENHDAIRAMDAAEDEARQRKERAADAASESAFAKVKPILTQEKGGVQADGSGSAASATV
jgi:hypothetical protein